MSTVQDFICGTHTSMYLFPDSSPAFRSHITVDHLYVNLCEELKKVCEAEMLC